MNDPPPPPAAPQPGDHGAALLERVCRSPSLPALPAVAVELLRATAGRDADLSRLAKLVTRDPALAAGVLRAANASHYGLRRRVTSVPQALPVLGLRNLRTLVAGLGILPALGRASDPGIDPADCSRRGLYSATAARRLAEQCGAPAPDDCFLSALLMDLGVLALARVVGAPYAALLARAERHTDLDGLEREALGLSHPEVGAALARRWRLPEDLAAPIQFHHDTESAPDGPARLAARILSLAGHGADVFLEHSPLWPLAECHRLNQEWFGRDRAATDLLLEGLAAETASLAATFQVKVDRSATLARARERAAEQFGAAPAPGRGPAPPAAGPEGRREDRSPRAGGLVVIPCTAGGVGRPFRAEFRDVSPGGIGLGFPGEVAAGSRFVVGLRPAGGRVTVVLYEVRHCAPAAEGGYLVGAELIRAMREQDLRNEPQGDSPLHRVGRLLMGSADGAGPGLAAAPAPPPRSRP